MKIMLLANVIICFQFFIVITFISLVTDLFSCQIFLSLVDFTVLCWRQLSISISFIEERNKQNTAIFGLD